MKVVFLNHFIAGGGAERVTCLLTNNLVNKGYSISMMTDLFKPFAYDVDETNMKTNFTIYRSMMRGNDLGSCSNSRYDCNQIH